VSWPPDEEGWAEILRELPEGADPGAVRAAIEAGVQEYLQTRHARGSPRQHEVWRGLQKTATSKGVSKLRRSLEKVGTLDPSNRDADWFRQLASNLSTLSAKARAWAEFHRPRTRRERFDSALLKAWIGPGRGPLAISSEGPLARFYMAITDRVLRRPIGSDAVKKIIRRERRRRELLETLGGEGKLITKEDLMWVVPGEKSAGESSQSQ
jgi:hypothetical protein